MAVELYDGDVEESIMYRVIRRYEREKESCLFVATRSDHEFGIVFQIQKKESY